MFDTKQFYSHGMWIVKNGQVKNFMALYKEFAEFAQKNYGLLEAGLLQEVGKTKYFVSFGLWENTKAAQKWKNSSEFEVYLTKFRELCDDIQIKILKSVSKVKNSNN